MAVFMSIFCLLVLILNLSLMMWGFVIGPASSIKDKDLKVSKHGA